MLWPGIQYVITRKSLNLSDLDIAIKLVNTIPKEKKLICSKLVLGGYSFNLPQGVETVRIVGMVGSVLRVTQKI